MTTKKREKIEPATLESLWDAFFDLGVILKEEDGVKDWVKDWAVETCQEQNLYVFCNKDEVAEAAVELCQEVQYVEGH